jgi:hypothetical protein
VKFKELLEKITSEGIIFHLTDGYNHTQRTVTEKQSPQFGQLKMIWKKMDIKLPVYEESLKSLLEIHVYTGKKIIHEKLLPFSSVVLLSLSSSKTLHQLV